MKTKGANSSIYKEVVTGKPVLETFEESLPRKKAIKPYKDRIDVLKEYAEKKAEAARIAVELQILEPRVLAHLGKLGADTLQETYGTFSAVYRKKWSYTPELIEKEHEYDVIIKDMKREEQVNGEAQFEETKGLSYREYKPNEKE